MRCIKYKRNTDHDPCQHTANSEQCGFGQEEGFDLFGFHTKRAENAHLTRTFVDSHQQSVHNNSRGHTKYHQVEEEHHRIGHLLNKDDELIHFFPVFDNVARGIDGSFDRSRIFHIVEQNIDHAGVIFSTGDGLRFFERHEDGRFVVAGCIGGVNAANSELLFVGNAIGCVHDQRDRVTHAEVQALCQGITDQDTITVVGGQEFAFKQTFAIFIIRSRRRIDPHDLHADGFLFERQHGACIQARGGYLDLVDGLDLV